MELTQRGVERLIKVESPVDVEAQHSAYRPRPPGVMHLLEEGQQVPKAVDRVGIGHPDRDEDLGAEHNGIDRQEPLVGGTVEEDVVKIIQLVLELAGEDLLAPLGGGKVELHIGQTLVADDHRQTRVDGIAGETFSERATGEHIGHRPPHLAGRTAEHEREVALLVEVQREHASRERWLR